MTVWPDGQGTCWIKENCVHLFRSYVSLGNTWAFFLSFRFHCLLSVLLCGSNMCAQVSSPVSKLEITRLWQPLYVFESSRAHLRRCLLLLSEQMRYPPSSKSFSGPNVFFFFQNCLHTAIWYASTTSYILDRQSRILFDHNLHSSDVSLDNRGLRPSRTGIIFNRKFPSFKSFNPPKTVRIEMVWDPYISHNSLNICFESILSIMRHLI